MVHSADPNPPPPAQTHALSQHLTRLRAIALLMLAALTAVSVAANSLFVYSERELDSSLQPPPSSEVQGRGKPNQQLLQISADQQYFPAQPFANISRATLIPQQILRTWVANNRVDMRNNSYYTSPEYADKFSAWFDQWAAVNPAATQIVFDNNDMDGFVRGAFSRRVVEAYFRLDSTHMRREFGKYLMMYEIGGYFLEMDTLCKKPIFHWNLGFNQAAVIIGVEVRQWHMQTYLICLGIQHPNLDGDTFSDWAFAAAPHHPLIANVIQRITNDIQASSYFKEVCFRCAWTQVVSDYLESVGTDVTSLSNLWDSYFLAADDVLVLGKAYLNNDNTENPKAFIHHHLTRGLRQPVTEEPTLSPMNDDFDWTYIPPKPSLLVNIKDSTSELPRQVYSVANSSSETGISPKFKGFRDEWIKMNPGYSFNLLSDADMDDFVRKECSAEVRAAFFKLPLLQQRVEMFRYILLEKKGGFYTEIDTRPHTPIDDWFLGRKKGVGFVLGIKDQSHPEGPGFVRTTLASVPSHPILTSYLKNKVTKVVAATREQLTHVSMFDFCEHDFNIHFKAALQDRGVNITHDFRTLAWEGFAEVEDVLVLGQERLHPSNERNGHNFARWHGDLWDREKGIWGDKNVTVE
ncbi:hypothetical protein BC830DRAFT_1231523 [Chytriomyces sp. MP71]|nr:hypothetical protein BC830DRAFT_1231523 [Chytriomyces sp. MP71]